MLRFADEFRLPGGRLTRRDWLRIGTLALPGWLCLAKPNTARSTENAATTTGPTGFGRAKSVILVFANGGQSQIDTWDPKPNPPLDVRGAFQPIGTAISGVQFCEHMPQIARLADRLTIVRSMSHED